MHQYKDYYEDDPEVRLGFIRKVYGILSVMLCVTVIMCIPSVVNTDYQKWQANNLWLMWVCLGIYIVLAITIICCRNVARSVPTNYILLFIFCMALSYIVSAICGTYSPEIVIMAAIMTLGVTVALTLYAMFTKTDFTVCGGVFFVLGMTLFLFAIFGLFFNQGWLYTFYCALGVIVYGLYLIMDTQLIMGNKTHKIEMDDYILGAFLLFIDIIMLFLYILRLFGQRS